MDKGLFLFCVENLSDRVKAILGTSGFSAEDILARQREVGDWLGAGGRFAFDAEAALRAYESAAAFLDKNPRAGFSVRSSPGYPPLLRRAGRPPWGLFYEGDLANDWERTVAAVGTRRPLPGSVRDAYRFGVECGLNGVGVASGFAYGLDQALMEGCLDGGGRTFGVLGCGLGCRCPLSDIRLRRRIVEGGGALVSQFHPLAAGRRFNFPLRNRTLASLCRSLVVFQAPAGSGALGTAGWALDEGRDVYVHSSALAGGPGFAGGRSLAEDGAPAVRSPGDLFPGAARTVSPVAYSPRLEGRRDGLYRIRNFWFLLDGGSNLL